MKLKKNSGKQTEKVPVQYDQAESVADMAKELIRKHHSELVNTKIAYLFKNKPIKSRGREVIAFVSKCSGIVKVLSEVDVVMIVSYPAYQPLSDKHKLAVIDHELTHLLVDEDSTGAPKVKLLAHDVEEFSAIIERHGLYQEDLVKLGRVIQTVTVYEGKSKKILKLKPGEDPVERAMAEDEDEELDEEDEEEAFLS
jgi:predicted metallopeptidase